MRDGRIVVDRPIEHRLFAAEELLKLPPTGPEPALTPAHVVDWALWMLTRRTHLRGNGPILV